jgi:hypothetical protein
MWFTSRVKVKSKYLKSSLYIGRHHWLSEAVICPHDEFGRRIIVFTPQFIRRTPHENTKQRPAKDLKDFTSI